MCGSGRGERLQPERSLSLSCHSVTEHGLIHNRWELHAAARPHAGSATCLHHIMTEAEQWHGDGPSATSRSVNTLKFWAQDTFDTFTTQEKFLKARSKWSSGHSERRRPAKVRLNAEPLCSTSLWAVRAAAHFSCHLIFRPHVCVFLVRDDGV